MSVKKKQVRSEFRTKCLKRDNHKCRFCGTTPPNGDEGLDVHHITDRTEMPFGGYVASNGISLCADCHIKAEEFHINQGVVWTENMHPNDLYVLIGSSLEQATQDSYRLLKDT